MDIQIASGSVPRVSVTMAVCNVERFLEEAIDSVLDQTLTDFELIVVDFGSTDRSRSIVALRAASDPRIRWVESTPCSLPEARDIACDLARGEYIAVMDADDRCVRDRLRLQADWLDAHESFALVGGSTIWMDANGELSEVHRYPSDPDEIRRRLESNFPFCHPALMMRRSAFVAVGGYRKAFAFAHDYDLAVRISEHYPCSNIDDVVLHYRVHASQISFMRYKKQTLCRLAAQVSRAVRADKREDLLDSVDDVTELLLLSLGMHEPEMRRIQLADARRWMRAMLDARAYASLLQMVDLEELRNPAIEGWQIADFQLLRAEALWHLGRRRDAFIAGVYALAASPRVVGRPLKRLLGLRRGSRIV